MEEYLKNRIAYLREQERLALTELDKYTAGSLERLGKWELIKALTERRRELEDAEQFLINCNNPPVSSSVILTQLTEKLIGMRKFVAEHYNDVGANGALTVINELERWIKVKVG